MLGLLQKQKQAPRRRSRGEWLVLGVALCLPAFSYALDVVHQGVISITAVVPATSTPAAASPVSSGGGFAYVHRAPLSIKGFGYPGRPVFITIFGDRTVEVLADISGAYEARIDRVPVGKQSITIWSVDSRGFKSGVRTLTIEVPQEAETIIDNVDVSPTLFVEQLEVRAGDLMRLSGFARPGTALTVVIDEKAVALSQKIIAGLDGSWRASIPTDRLTSGSHTLRARYTDQPYFSRFASIKIGVRTLAASLEALDQKVFGDVNGDRRVNLQDFSILAFWYRKEKPPAAVDLNNDGRVTIIDFSILAYAWDE